MLTARTAAFLAFFGMSGLLHRAATFVALSIRPTPGISAAHPRRHDPTTASGRRSRPSWRYSSFIAVGGQEDRENLALDRRAPAHNG